MFLDVSCLGALRKGFDRGNRDYDLWGGDELAGYELDVDTLNMLLDGQTMSLDTKYGRANQ